MLNNIKKIVAQKKEFMESAGILFDEVSINGTTLFEESILEEAEEGAIGTPEPVITEPQEPVAGPIQSDETDDLLSVEINSRNGVVRDTLPVEPANTESEPEEPAAEPVGDIMDELVGDDNADSEPATDPEPENDDDSFGESTEDSSDDDIFNEAISMGGGDKDKDDDKEDKDDDEEKGDDSSKDDDKPKEDDILDSEIEDGETEGEDNSVTAAVKDKVAEAEDGDDNESEAEEPAAEPEETPAAQMDNTAILDKLDDLQKNIMKVKDEVKKQIN